jgi:hypothetical protein
MLRREANFDLTSQHIRLQSPWDSHERGIAVPWQTYVKRFGSPNSKKSYPNGASRFDLGPKPKWVAKAPGTGGSTFERPPLRKSADFGAFWGSTGPPPRWNERFVVAHSIDRNPVENGMRKGIDNRTGVGALCSLDPAGGDKYESP